MKCARFPERNVVLNFIQLFLTSDSCPASFNTGQSATNSWTRRAGGGSPLPLTPQAPAGAAVSPRPSRGVPMSLGQCPHIPPAVSPRPSCGAGGAAGPLCSASGQSSWQRARDCCGLRAVCGLKTELK